MAGALSRDSLFLAPIPQDFTEQFQVLLPKNAQPCREVISALLEKMDIDKRSYQIGKTKVRTPAPRGASSVHRVLPRPERQGTLLRKCLFWGPAPISSQKAKGASKGRGPDITHSLGLLQGTQGPVGTS